MEVNGERIEDEFTFVCVCNGRYYGGGFNPVPNADPTDGMLDVLLVKKVSPLKAAPLVSKYKSGRYAEMTDYIRYFRTDRLKVICEKPNDVNMDGEIRSAEVVELSVAKEKIRFFYPRGLHWKRP